MREKWRNNFKIWPESSRMFALILGWERSSQISQFNSPSFGSLTQVYFPDVSFRIPRFYLYPTSMTTFITVFLSWGLSYIIWRLKCLDWCEVQGLSCLYMCDNGFGKVEIWRENLNFARVSLDLNVLFPISAYGTYCILYGSSSWAVGNLERHGNQNISEILKSSRIDRFLRGQMKCSVEGNNMCISGSSGTTIFRRRRVMFPKAACLVVGHAEVILFQGPLGSS